MSAYRIHYQFLTLMLLLLCSSAAIASQTSTNMAPWQEQRSLHAAAGGLLYSLPSIDRMQLGREVRQLNLQLKVRQQELANLLEQNRFTAGDAVIVAVLPGGLIYAALKRQRSTRAETELLQVTEQLKALQGFHVNQDSIQPMQPLLAAR